MYRFSALLIVALAATCAFGQIWSGDALQLPAGSTVTVDGYLDEGLWAGLTKTKLDATSYLQVGVIDGDGDCYTEFVTAWDASALYVGLWFYDDTHNAPHSQYLDDANNAYDDDGMEWFINHSFEDGFNDVTDPYRGLYGWQLVKGFGNLTAADQHGGSWGDGPQGWSTAVYSKADQETKGWYETFTSADGVNFTDEMKLTWAGNVMNGKGTAAAGDRIGYNMKVNDNDGVFTAEGSLNITKISHQGGAGSGQNWGLLTLSATQAGVKPVRSIAMPKTAAMQTAAYDIQGRAIRSTATRSVARIAIDRTGKVTRNMIVR